MQLSEIQTRFKDMIFDRAIPADTAAIFAANDTSLLARVDIYRNNIMSSISNALMNNFPLIEKLVGRDFLNLMARTYIKQTPPISGCLTFYGADFGDFIENYEPAKELPYLADMARLEIMCNQSYHAQDDQALSATDLAEIPEDRLDVLRLKLRDSVQLLQSGWPLEALKNFCKEEGPAPDINSNGAFLLIHRPHLEVQIAKLNNSQFEFLSRIKEKPLGQSVAETLLIYPDFDFPKTFQSFMTLGIFLKDQ